MEQRQVKQILEIVDESFDRLENLIDMPSFGNVDGM